MILTNDPRQLDLAGPADHAGHAQQGANQPLRPSRPQEPCDIGLFGDGARQVDLEDLIAAARR